METSTGKNRNLKCWKCQEVEHIVKECPKKSTMIIGGWEIVVSVSEDDDKTKNLIRDDEEEKEVEDTSCFP